MTKKRKIILISVVIAVLIAGGVTAYALRNIFEKPPVVIEQTTTDTVTDETVAEAPKTTLTGTFVGVDDIHWGRGSVEVVESQSGPRLVFKDDFEVAQGPDLQVYLSPNPAGQDLGEYASLGVLKANAGTQEYTLPDDYKKYKTVVVWCRAFAVTFATAELQ